MYSECSLHLQMLDTLAFSITGLLKLNYSTPVAMPSLSLRPLQVTNLLRGCRQNTLLLCHHPLAEPQVPHSRHIDRLKKKKSYTWYTWQQAQLF